MKSIFSILFIAFISISISAQSQVELLLKDAKEYNAAFLKGDFETYVGMTIPSVIEVAGGTEVMVTNAKASYEMTGVFCANLYYLAQGLGDGARGAITGGRGWGGGGGGGAPHPPP